MPKRPLEESEEDRWLRKMKKYEAKLKKKRLIIYSDEEQDEENPETQPDETWYPSYEEQPAVPILAAQDLEESVPAQNDSPADTCPSTEPSVPVEPTISAEASGAAAADTAGCLDVDPELLVALGILEEDTTEWGEPIVEHIALRLKPILINGMKKEDKEILLKKYPFPKNLTLAKAPTLNAEISTMLNEPSRNRDKRLYVKQNQLGIVMSGITKAMSLLLCKDPKLVDILSILSDTSKLLADSHYLETDTRRSLITPLIDKELIDPFKDRKRDEFVFGENLGELVKNSRGIKKTGQLIQATPMSNLNLRGPSSRGRHQKNQTIRGGGQQRPYHPYRRRAAPYPQPAAPARRQPYAQPAARRPPVVTATSAPRSTTTTTDRTTRGTLP